MNMNISVDRLEQLAFLYGVPVEVDYTARRMVLELDWVTYFAPLPEVAEVPC